MGILVDIDINSYFDVSIANFDKRKFVQLDLRRKNHTERFCKKAEEIVDAVELENMIATFEDKESPQFVIEAIDKEFTYIFKSAAMHAYRRDKNMPSNIEKNKLYSAKFIGITVSNLLQESQLT